MRSDYPYELATDPGELRHAVVTDWHEACWVCGNRQLDAIGRLGYFRNIDGAQVCGRCAEAWTRCSECGAYRPGELCAATPDGPQVYCAVCASERAEVEAAVIVGPWPGSEVAAR